jgi:hypothetical protein
VAVLALVPARMVERDGLPGDRCMAHVARQRIVFPRRQMAVCAGVAGSVVEACRQPGGPGLVANGAVARKVPGRGCRCVAACTAGQIGVIDSEQGPASRQMAAIALAGVVHLRSVLRVTSTTVLKRAMLVARADTSLDVMAIGAWGVVVGAQGVLRVALLAGELSVPIVTEPACRPTASGVAAAAVNEEMREANGMAAGCCGRVTVEAGVTRLGIPSVFRVDGGRP